MVKSDCLWLVGLGELKLYYLHDDSILTDIIEYVRSVF